MAQIEEAAAAPAQAAAPRTIPALWQAAIARPRQGLAHVGAITVPVYTSTSARECAYLLAHADAVGVVVEDEAQRAKVEEVRRELPRLEHVLSFAELDALAERGRARAQ